MFIIVGLGNPGKKYALTRHNAGSMVADALAEELHAPAFTLNKRHHALIAESAINNQRSLIIAKPQTFMNLSGASVAALVKKSGKMEIKKTLMIISDDLDLPFGEIRYREKGSAGGHNGLQSIIDALGTHEFPRVKIGIRPPHLSRQPGKAEEFVLERFTPDEQKELGEKIIPEAVRTIISKFKMQISKPQLKA